MADLEENTIIEKKIYFPEIILKIPELKTFFEIWFPHKKDLNLKTSLLNKIDQLSLKPQTILALILYLFSKKKPISQKN